MAGKTKVECSKCGRPCNTSQIQRHEKACKGLPFEKKWSKRIDGTYVCLICGQKSTKSGIGNHVKYHEGFMNPRIGAVAWNRGLSKDTSEIISQYSLKTKERYKTGELIPSFKGRKHSQSTYEIWAKNPNMGGRREGSGRGKKGKYKGYYCDSTWELAWLVFILDQGKTPIRNTKGFEYEGEGQVHKYFPDFILDDCFYEIKGQKGPQWEAKIAAWKETKPLVIVDKYEIKPYIEYAEQKFGKEFWIIAYGDSFKQTIFKPGA
jgi:hypothetical protein